MKDLIARLECRDCAFSNGTKCMREGFSQNYERIYTDSDFCGPQGRFFQRKTISTRIKAAITALKARENDDG